MSLGDCHFSNLCQSDGVPAEDIDAGPPLVGRPLPAEICRALSPGTVLYYAVLQSPEYVAHITEGHYLQVLYCTMMYLNNLNIGLT